ncbi:MAG: DUF5689 domain-containing protein [Rikenellaceae bacterium]
MGRFIKYITSVVAVALMSGCYDSFRGGGSIQVGPAPASNITIAQLHTMLESESMLVYDDFIVRGTVTSTDRYGNFYKTFVMEDNGYGVEILEGLTDSYVRHDVGSVVVVKLQGLMCSRYLGVLQVGAKASEGSYYTLDYLGVEQVVDEVVFNSGTYSSAEPYTVDVSGLDSSMCGRLINIESLLHTPGEDDTQPYVWGGYQQFVDNSGGSVWCYTSDYATFASLAIPQQSVSLCGVLQWGSISGVSGGEQYIIEMRGVYDCVSEE